MKKSNKSLIIIDTSYVSFYRFYASIRWFSFAFPEEFKKNNNPEFDWFSNTNFIEKYKKLYLQSIINIVTLPLFQKSIILFCLDSQQNKIWRNKIYPNYKNKRKNTEYKYNFKTVFQYTYDILLPIIINEHDNIYSIKVNKLEADDIIACITMYIKSNYQNYYIRILSGDNDLLQLGTYNVSFINLKNKLEKILTPHDALLELNKKIIFGDNSDNIPGIFEKGYGVKKNDLLNPNILNKYLYSNATAKYQYKLNKKLIDFNYIPKKYYNKIIDNIITIISF